MVRTNTKEKDLKKTTLFISYSWVNANSAKLLEEEFRRIEWLKVFKDTINVEYNDSIKKFMNDISKCDYVVCLISDAYLKSKNCMYEVMQLMKDSFYQERVRFIVVKKEEDDEIFDIYGDVSKRKKYINYWEDKIKELNKKSKSEKLLKEEIRDLKLYKTIRKNIEEFFELLKDKKSFNQEELQKGNFQPLINTIKKNNEKTISKTLIIPYYVLVAFLFFANLFSYIFAYDNKLSIFVYVSFLLSCFLCVINVVLRVNIIQRGKSKSKNILFISLYVAGVILFCFEMIGLYFDFYKEFLKGIIICTICIFFVTIIAYILNMRERPLIHSAMQREKNFLQLLRFYIFSCVFSGVNLIMLMLTKLPAGEWFLFVRVTSSSYVNYLSVYLPIQMGMIISCSMVKFSNRILYKNGSLTDVEPIFILPWYIVTLFCMLSLF